MSHYELGIKLAEEQFGVKIAISNKMIANALSKVHPERLKQLSSPLMRRVEFGAAAQLPSRLGSRARLGVDEVSSIIKADLDRGAWNLRQGGDTAYDAVKNIGAEQPRNILHKARNKVVGARPRDVPEIFAGSEAYQAGLQGKYVAPAAPKSAPTTMTAAQRRADQVKYLERQKRIGTMSRGMADQRLQALA